MAQAFTEPIKVADRANFESETFVTVTPDGQTILLCMHGEFVQQPMMLASTDGGVSFRTLTVTPPSTGGDCDDTIGEGDRWYWVHSTVVGATVVSTEDQGATWIDSRITAVPTNGLADRPWIATAGPDVFLTYVPVWWEPGTVGFVKSEDEGRTWSMPMQLSTMSRDNFSVYAPEMIVSPDERTVRVPIFTFPQIPYTEAPVASTGWFHLAVSRDRGETWTDQFVMGPMEEGVRAHTTAAMAGDSTLYWAYIVQEGNLWKAMAIFSLDDGETWSEPHEVWSGFTFLALPLMDGRPDGTATLILQGNGEAVSPGAAGNHVIAVRLDARAPQIVQWVAPLHAGGGEFSSVDHDAAGRAYVAYISGNSLWLQKEL